MSDMYKILAFLKEELKYGYRGRNNYLFTFYVHGDKSRKTKPSV